MVAINFSPQFAGAVESGAKRQTIRRRRKYIPKPGDALQLYARRWLFFRRKLRDAVCTSVTPVRIEWLWLFLDHRAISPSSGFDVQESFARKDGFSSYPNMAEWFRARYGLPFDGVMIEWV